MTLGDTTSEFEEITGGYHVTQEPQKVPAPTAVNVTLPPVQIFVLLVVIDTGKNGTVIAMVFVVIQPSELVAVAV